MVKPKLLPEQKLEDKCSDSKNNLKISKEFRKAIDASADYVGQLSLNDEKVELSCLNQAGYHPDIKLEHFLQGALYAGLAGKNPALYYPEGSESEVLEKINKTLTTAIKAMEFTAYSGVPLFKVIVTRRPLE